MEIDIILESHDSADDIAELGAIAESCGFRALWVSNRYDSRDPFTNLSVLARSTSKIKMGPIAVSPFELHPLKMASALLTLNELSNGRACIVVGGGGGTMYAMGIKPKKIATAVRECVEILKATSSGELVNYDGEIYRVKGYDPFWAKAESPIIYVGANQESMLRMGGRVGDGIMVSDFTPKMLKEAMGHIKTGLSSKGRSVDDFRINNFWAWHVKEDLAEAVKEAREYLAVRGGLERFWLDAVLSKEDADYVEPRVGNFFDAMHKRTHIIEDVPDRIVNALVNELTCTGTIDALDEQIALLQGFKEAGLTEIALRVYQDPASSIRLIGEKVVPALS